MQGNHIPLPDDVGAHMTSTVRLSGKPKVTYFGTGDGFIAADRSSAVRFLAAAAILLAVIVAGIAICSGRAYATPGQCVYSGFGGWCDGQYVDPATGIYEHCEWGGFIVFTRNCFLVRPVPVDVDPRGWVPL